MKNLTVEMLKSYVVQEQQALSIANWWNNRENLLIVIGQSGSGKTSFAEGIAQLMQVPFYRLNCHKSIGKAEVLYGWDKSLQHSLLQEVARENSNSVSLPQDPSKIIYGNKTMVLGVLGQSLMDKDEDIVVLIDGIDALPNRKGKSIQALLLEFLEEAVITVPELNSKISSRSGKRPHIVITVNRANTANTKTVKESLFPPLIRRGIPVYLAELDPTYQISILEKSVPNLAKEVIKNVVGFAFWAKKLVRLEKPIALSEVINWAKTLEILGVKELNSSVVELTVSELAKRQNDQARLLINTNRILKIVQQGC